MCPFLDTWRHPNVADTDPKSGVFLTHGSGSGMGKQSESGINIPDNFSESLETFFRPKNTNDLWRGIGSGIRNRFDPSSGIRDPQHWEENTSF